MCAVAVVLALAAPARTAAAQPGPSVVTIKVTPDHRFGFFVNGQEQLLVGMGYNPIYRSLPVAQRALNYQRDFRTLCLAGVNTITGWDSDKGYDQDKFDELTLDSAYQFGIGLVMPMYLPADGDYQDPNLIGSLIQGAVAKAQRFKNHPALRMWGVGNEVMSVMQPEMYPAFLQVYLNVIDLIHQIDPNHPVIYREAEDDFVPQLTQLLRDSGDSRPWWLYGMNIYDKDPEPLLRRWPSYGWNRPLVISEFGADGGFGATRAEGYVSMWRAFRAHPDFVLGAAPYVWTAAGPEPTDAKWGLMNSQGQPVDDTFGRLQRLWQAEPRANHTANYCGH
jgi:hypothetical protein